MGYGLGLWALGWGVREHLGLGETWRRGRSGGDLLSVSPVFLICEIIFGFVPRLIRRLGVRVVLEELRLRDSGFGIRDLGLGDGWGCGRRDGDPPSTPPDLFFF